MSNPYEVEHNIKDAPKTRTRRPSMSSFFNQLSQVTTSSDHHNPNAIPTPADLESTIRLVQDQMLTLRATAPSEQNEALLTSLAQQLEATIEDPPTEIQGVPQSFLDELERVPKKALKKTDSCPICAEVFLDDPYPLVVELGCHPTHRFDLECVGPWLRLNGTCPLDRKVLMKKKEVVKEKEEEEEEDYDDLYA